MLRTRSVTVNDLWAPSVLRRQVIVRPRRLHLPTADARAFANVTPFGSVSVTTTVWAVRLLRFDTFIVRAKLLPPRTVLGALALIAVSTTRCAEVRSPSTSCPSSGLANPQVPVDGPS